jgi:DNA primase
VYMDAVADIKARLNIEDVVSEYVELKRSGRNFKGLSPFTSEKSPSFMVSPEKQIWHDFSSGKGGDMFTFIQEVEGLDFKGALELLGRKAGIDLSEYKTQQSTAAAGKSKERLFAAVEESVLFYQKQLLKSNAALKYLREKRGYEKQTILDFRFGYSPEKGDALTSHLMAKGYELQELKRVGLSGDRSGRVYDMFRGRIMIPLLDPQGRPVGFTARQLTADSNSPKYINTPSTPLYDKGRQVFGLSQAKEAIRKAGFVVVVEGNLDVVASHQAGISQVVASAGTALTAYHLKSLQRFTGDVRVAFDDDRAGQEAAERTIPLAQELGIEMSIISLPKGKDPDELIKHDVAAWQAAVDSPKYMVDWLIERVASSIDLQTAQGKRQFTSRILQTVRQLKDSVEQEHYAQLIAKKVGSSIETINDKLQQQTTVKKRLKRTTPNNEESEVRDQRVREQHLLSICMKQVVVGEMLKNVPLDIFSNEAKEVATFLQEYPGVSPTESEYGKMLTLLFEEYYQNTEEDELLYQAKRLLSRLVSTYANMKKQSLIMEMDEADDYKQRTVLTAVKQLDDLVVQFSSK